MIIRARRTVAIAMASLALAFPGAAPAETFPTRPVRMVVPFPPGGATDIVGRLLAGKMQEIWKQPVIVENKPGAGTVVATDFVSKAAPDGYTLGFVITAHVINPSLRSNLPYDTLKDLAAVTQVSQQHMVVAANPSFEAKTIAELIALAKKSPGKIAYATPGEGTAMHLTIERLKSATGIDLIHVPYKGGAPAQQDVLGGRVPLLVDVHYAVEPLLKAGKLRALALLSPQKVKSIPGLPVIADTVPGVSALSMVGIVAPGATPPDLVRRISSDVAAALRSPDLRQRMLEVGMEPVGSTPEQFHSFIRSEIERWSAVVKASGAKIE